MKLKSLTDAELYLDGFISPVIERIEKNAKLPDPLDRMREFLRLLGNPHEKYPSVQVSGTSGKTSTTYMIAGILAEAGYKVGMTISPHLESITERIQTNTGHGVRSPGLRQIPEKEFVRLLNTLVPIIDEMKHTAIGAPSYFEILLAVAFLYFAQEQIAILVAEVGLEGSYDGTNVLSPYAAVLTNISLDHTAILGNTVEKIAEEATAIIKKSNGSGKQIVITGVKQASVLRIIKEKAEKNNAEPVILGEDFFYEMKRDDSGNPRFDFIQKDVKLADAELSLKGEHQVVNASIAVEVCLQLRKFGFTVSETAIRRALGAVFVPGRFEVMRSKIHNADRTVLLDGAHNDAKMEAFIQTLIRYFPTKKFTFIIGFKDKKEIDTMLSFIMPYASSIVVTEFHGTQEQSKNNAMKKEKIKYEIASMKYKENIQIFLTPNIQEALSKALELSEEQSTIVVTGSLYLVGEARASLKRITE